MNTNHLQAPELDPNVFLQLAARGAEVASHAQLWHWLGADVQPWLAHQAVIVGWGDFDRDGIGYDVISSVPGLRSHDFTAARIAPLLRYLRDCWVAGRRAPCEVDLAGSDHLLRDCSIETRRALATMRTALVHGVREGHSGRERIFAALSRHPRLPAASGTALKVLVPFIDSALRRIPPLPPRHPGGNPPAPPGPSRAMELSEREREIMQWVALGKTNPEIGCILSISEFTVKNHLKSIFAKLDVSNRAQAVARLTKAAAHA